MSSLFTNIPATRLICRACRQRQGVIASPWTLAATPEQDTRGQQYSQSARPKRPIKKTQPPKITPAPPKGWSDSPRVIAKISDSHAKDIKDSERLVFKPEDVPPLSKWVASIENLGIEFFSAIDCMQAAQTYVSIASQHESLWRHKLESEYNLSPFKLHWIAIILMNANDSTRWRIGTHMMRSASELGFAPSILTLARISTQLPAHAANSKIFKGALERMNDIVQSNRNPDALTLQGMMYVKEGNQTKAWDAFQRATAAWEKANAAHESENADDGKDSQDASAGDDTSEFILPAPREPRWEWEVSCVLGQADILYGLGKVNEATSLYRVAALELDNPRAFMTLARLLEGPPDSSERRTYLLKAAISGDEEACRQLSDLEKTAATRPGISKKMKQEHDLLSQEWLRLAEGGMLSAINEADVGDAEAD